MHDAGHVIEEDSKEDIFPADDTLFAKEGDVNVPVTSAGVGQGTIGFVYGGGDTPLQLDEHAIRQAALFNEGLPSDLADREPYFDENVKRPPASGSRTMTPPDMQRTALPGWLPQQQSARNIVNVPDREIQAVLDRHAALPAVDEEFSKLMGMGPSRAPDRGRPMHALHKYHYTTNTFPRHSWDSHDFNPPTGSSVSHPNAHALPLRSSSLTSTFAYRSMTSPYSSHPSTYSSLRAHRLDGILQVSPVDACHRSSSVR
jgi:hypothetical protein